MKLQNISELGKYDFRASIPNSENSPIEISKGEQLLWRHAVEVLSNYPGTPYDVIKKSVFFPKEEL